MKKTITILSLCLFSFANTQHVYAQENNSKETFDFDPPRIPNHLPNDSIIKLTKEETFKWIKKTLETCCNKDWDYDTYTISNVEIDNCKISWKEYTSDPDVDYVTYKVSIDLTKTGFFYSTDNGDIDLEKGEFLYTKLEGYGDDGKYQAYHLDGTKTQLVNDMADALNHLSKFCTQ